MLHFARKLLSSFRLPSKVGGDLNFILLSFKDEAAAILGFCGSGSFGGVKYDDNLGIVTGGVYGKVFGKGTVSSFGSRDKAEIACAERSSSASCSLVGIFTSSSMYLISCSFLSSSNGFSFSSSSDDDDDSPTDGSQ